MYPAPFRYIQPKNVDDALSWAEEGGKFLAGGQSLLPLLNLHLSQVPYLVDINELDELQGEVAYTEAGMVRIPALTRHRQLVASPVVRTDCPLLAEAAQWIGNPRVRGRGTTGGSLAHADPAAELATALLALDARIVVRGRDGERSYRVAEFFLGPLMSVLEPGQLVSWVEVPRQAPTERWAFVEFVRRPGDFALVAVAVRMSVDDSDTVLSAALSVGGVEATVRRLAGVESRLVGQTLQPDLLEQVAQWAQAAVEPVSDPFASEDYRRHLTGVLVRRALEEVAGARGGRTGHGGSVDVKR
jgi:CO/xanthine dehydrogenase FAD-binding subunit